MPLTEKGEKIKHAMEEQYGEKKGKQVFYASKNKGTITGVDSDGGKMAADATLDNAGPSNGYSLPAPSWMTVQK